MNDDHHNKFTRGEILFTVAAAIIIVFVACVLPLLHGF